MNNDSSPHWIFRTMLFTGLTTVVICAVLWDSYSWTRWVNLVGAGILVIGLRNALWTKD